MSCESCLRRVLILEKVAGRAPGGRASRATATVLHFNSRSLSDRYNERQQQLRVSCSSLSGTELILSVAAVKSAPKGRFARTVNASGQTEARTSCPARTIAVHAAPRARPGFPAWGATCAVKVNAFWSCSTTTTAGNAARFAPLAHPVTKVGSPPHPPTGTADRQVKCQ